MTGLGAGLCESFRVGVLSALLYDDGFVNDCEAVGVAAFAPMPAFPPDRGIRQHVYALCNRALRGIDRRELLATGAVKTLAIEEQRHRRRAPMRAFARRLVGRLAQHVPGVRQLIRGIEAAVVPLDVVTTLREWKPEGAVVLDIFKPPLPPVYRALAAEGISTIGFVQSWDNLTAKGRLPHQFDGLVVWNDLMRHEALTLYPWLDASRVFGSGAMQFSASSPPPPEDRAVFLESLGFEPEARLVTFMLSYPDLVAGYSEHLDMLIAARRRGEFGDRTRILVRPQPGPRSDAVYETLSRFEGEVRVDWESRTEPTELSWHRYRDDLRRLGRILGHTDLLVNYISTTTIDAAVVDLPNVSIAFDGYTDAEYFSSIRRYLDRSHYAPLAEREGNWICRSEAELIEAVKGYLADPSIHRAGRRAIVREIANLSDEPSGRRAGAFVRSVFDIHPMVSRC